MSVAHQEQGTKEPPEKDEAELARRGGRTLSPLVLSILGGIGTALLAILNNSFQWFQTQSAENLKLRASLIEKALENPSVTERRKNLKFLVTAGLIKDPGKKIENLEDKDIPQRFTFIPTTALTPELQMRLDGALRDFQDYVASTGLKTDAQPRVNIRPSGELRQSNRYCYYDAAAPGGPQLVVDGNYAEDVDLALREYSHHVMTINRAAGDTKYPPDDDKWKTYWPHFAIESALAFYLPCSFHNSPTFAEAAVRKGVPQIDLAKSHNLSELMADPYAMYYLDAEIWGNLFWELRTKLRNPKIDALLVRAWSTLNENGSVETQNRAFGLALEQAVSNELGNDSTVTVKKVFSAHGLSL